MKKILIMVAVWFSASVQAQPLTPERYIELYKDMAIREMKRMGVPASITLAQGILETESGNSVLVKKSNNHFGIKCKSSWTAGGVSHDDDAVGECFRQYKTAEDSYRDHSNFLRGNGRYSALFRLDVRDYKGWAYGLKKAGYATNPSYPQILIRNIEKYNLHQYTLQGADEVPTFNNDQYTDDPEEKTVPSSGDDQILIGTRTVSETHDGVTTVLADADETPLYSKVYRENGKKVLLGKKGASLLRIADDHDIRLVKLMEYNDLKTDGILEQDKVLYLEPRGKQMAAAGSKKPISHVVQPKEGLYSISKKYGVTVQQLKDWNKLDGDALIVGQELLVGGE